MPAPLFSIETKGASSSLAAIWQQHRRQRPLVQHAGASRVDQLVPGAPAIDTRCRLLEPEQAAAPTEMRQIRNGQPPSVGLDSPIDWIRVRRPWSYPHRAFQGTGHTGRKSPPAGSACRSASRSPVYITSSARGRIHLLPGRGPGRRSSNGHDHYRIR